MATIVLYKDKLNGVGGLIDKMIKSVDNLDIQLGTLKKTLQGVDSDDYNLDDTVESIRSSSKAEKDKIADLKKLNKKVNDFITTTVNAEKAVEEVINQKKKDFYTKYKYLKPDCEKDFGEKILDGVKSTWEFCKENWQTIKSVIAVVAVVVAVVAIVVASVFTFGGAAVLAAAIVGVAAGIGCQLLSDTVSFFVTGDWDSGWQDYAGAAVGGLAGGMAFLTGNPLLASTVEAYVATYFSGHLSNITGGEKKSSFEIYNEAIFSAGLAFGLGKMTGGLTKKTQKALASKFKNITFFRRMYGRGTISYEGAYNMAITRLKRGSYSRFTSKTIRNGVVSQLTGSFFDNVITGGIDGGKEQVDESNVVENIRKIISSPTKK